MRRPATAIRRRADRSSGFGSRQGSIVDSPLQWYATLMSSLRLSATYDDEARVWIVSDDRLGLVAEADTVELLEKTTWAFA